MHVAKSVTPTDIKVFLESNDVPDSGEGMYEGDRVYFMRIKSADWYNVWIPDPKEWELFDISEALTVRELIHTHNKVTGRAFIGQFTQNEVEWPATTALGLLQRSRNRMHTT